MDCSIFLLNIGVRRRSLPNYFVTKIRRSEHPVQQHPQIMARGRVAMEIEAARGFEDAMQFHQTRGHHRQIRHHGGGSEKAVEGLHHVHDGGVRAIVHKLGVGLRGVRPIPGVGEGVKLRLAGFPGSLAEKDVVIGVGIEGRVEINEVNAGVGKFLRVAQPTEIVAKEKPVHADALKQLRTREREGNVAKEAVSVSRGRLSSFVRIL